MICKCLEKEMLVTDVYEKAGSGEQKFMLYFIYLCTEVYATRTSLCFMRSHLLLLQIYLASLHLFPATSCLQLASSRCNLTEPCPGHSLPASRFLFCSWLSCGMEQPVKHVRYFGIGSSCFPASPSLSLGLAPWISLA